TRDSFVGRMNELFAKYRTVDEDFFEELEEVLISADVGVTTVLELIEELKDEVRLKNVKETKDIGPIISEKLAEKLDKTEEDAHLNMQEDALTIILFVGVNGVGKTTTIGKLAHHFKEEGKHVVLAAGDTFRAGAIEQLEVWGERTGVEVIKQSAGSDPAAVIFDGIKAAKAREADVLICDTAGRLQRSEEHTSELQSR